MPSDYDNLANVSALIGTVQAINSEKRAIRLTEYRGKPVVKGDFEGSVTGYWVKMDTTGSGVVSYRYKEYICEPIGFVSLPKGTPVELTFANGIYYAKF
jgi:hypothetical protein